MRAANLGLTHSGGSAPHCHEKTSNQAEPGCQAAIPQSGAQGRRALLKTARKYYITFKINTLLAELPVQFRYVAVAAGVFSDLRDALLTNQAIWRDSPRF